MLNNMCESFNSKLDAGRDAPIIGCLEFIREYIMKKIVTVDRVIEKATGHLTTTAAQNMERIKEEASEYIASYCGNGKYMVTGPWFDQCAVELGNGTCTCMKWELTGMPCKHVVATIWDMRKNQVGVGIPESFVHPCYHLSTWREMYSFKLARINGRTMWAKSPCPTTLLPPNHHVQVGRHKKKRKKSALETDDMVRGHKMTRAYREVTCAKCKGK